MKCGRQNGVSSTSTFSTHLPLSPSSLMTLELSFVSFRYSNERFVRGKDWQAKCGMSRNQRTFHRFVLVTQRRANGRIGK